MSAPLFVPQHVACPDCEAILIDHLDADWATPCDVGRAPVGREPIGPPGAGACGKPAAWIAWSVRCCEARAAAIVMCDDHKAMLLTHPFGVCQFCEEVFSPASAGVRLIEPLNRRPQ